VFKLVTPRLAPARFGQYMLEIPMGGQDAPLDPTLEHFLLGLDGAATVTAAGEPHPLSDGGFVFVPPGTHARLVTRPDATATVMWLKRAYEPTTAGAAPPTHSGRLADVAAEQTPVAGLARRELLDPLDAARDFNISHMEFEPGVALTQIEIHDEEHGLYMTSGDGLYHLNGAELRVQAGDFIYMAPYCPQGFVAGPSGGSYLLYKDVYRDGF
jgi:(S)-ureidoglycine aminohydrolase